jgi:hypothetical protein
LVETEEEFEVAQFGGEELEAVAAVDHAVDGGVRASQGRYNSKAPQRVACESSRGLLCTYTKMVVAVVEIRGVLLFSLVL